MIRLTATVLAVLLAGPTPPPSAHPGPPVYVEVDVGDAEVTLRFTGEQVTWHRWFGRPDPEQVVLTAPLPAAAVDEVRSAARQFLAENARVEVDGAIAAPAIDSIDVPPDDVTGYGVPALTFTLRFSLAARPRHVGLEWRMWEGLTWFDATKLPVVFRSFGDAQLVFLTPEEPGYTWRPETVVPRDRAEVVAIESPPAPRWPLPVVSLAVVAALLGAMPFLVRARVGAAVLLALTTSAGLTAWIARHAVVVEVPDPFHAAVAVPDEVGAIALFEQLQRNVYAAFDARTEDEIYDRLALSVAPELLDEMYGEVYESLIMRGQGGAVCQVERLEVLEREPDVDAVYEPWDFVPDGRDDDPFFKIRWKWNAYGVVSHWGHEHRRVNAYEALYTVRHGPRGWRIAACEILDQSRIDSDGPR